MEHGDHASLSRSCTLNPENKTTVVWHTPGWDHRDLIRHSKPPCPLYSDTVEPVLTLRVESFGSSPVVVKVHSLLDSSSWTVGAEFLLKLQVSRGQACSDPYTIKKVEHSLGSPVTSQYIHLFHASRSPPVLPAVVILRSLCPLSWLMGLGEWVHYFVKRRRHGFVVGTVAVPGMQ